VLSNPVGGYSSAATTKEKEEEKKEKKALGRLGIGINQGTS